MAAGKSLGGGSKDAQWVYALIIVLFILIAGFSGLFKTTWNIGAMIAKIPIWFWLVLGLLWLIKIFRS